MAKGAYSRSLTLINSRLLICNYGFALYRRIPVRTASFASLLETGMNASTRDNSYSGSVQIAALKPALTAIPNFLATPETDDPGAMASATIRFLSATRKLRLPSGMASAEGT